MDANGVHLVITGDFCPACGECILDRENGDRYGAALKEGRVRAGMRLAALCGTASDMDDIPRRRPEKPPT
ncbi:hypothetical protein SAMN05216303_10866 [Rhodoferax sp. OV413]|nr:hypothetical protein SAMN05216303_10866 [Rhodoferax sp. OV413]